MLINIALPTILTLISLNKKPSRSKRDLQTKVLFLRNQPHLIVIEEIIPCPVEHDNNAVTKTDDAIDM